MSKVITDFIVFEIGEKFEISPTGVSVVARRIEKTMKVDRKLKRKVEKIIKKQSVA